MAFDIIAARGYGSAEDGDASNPATINHYAAVSAIDSSNNTITVDDATNFTAGTEILLHISGLKSDSGNKAYLGRYKFAKVMSVNGNVLTLSARPLNLTVDYYFYQAISVPHYKTLTISETISPPAFSNGVGGLLVFKATCLKMSGAINLVEKGLTSDSQRPLLNQEEHGTLDTDTYSGYENYETVNHLTLQKGDGACLIIAKRIDFESTARIGNPNFAGRQRCRGASDSIDRNSAQTNIGGSSILICAETINNFSSSIISKYRANNLTSGKGLCRAYIATESTLAFDEGLYSYDNISTPDRLSKATLIDGFGSGSRKASNLSSQQNNYAKVYKISEDGFTFSLTGITTDGVAKFERDALVMIHASYRNTTTHVGRFFISTVIGTTSNSITLKNSIHELELGDFDLDHYIFQAVTIPQYSSITKSFSNIATLKWTGIKGGIFAIAVKGTCDLSGSKIDVAGKGGSTYFAGISNAQMKNRLPIGAGNGSVFILAKKLVVNSATRMGSTHPGNIFGGDCGKSTPENVGGYMGKRHAFANDEYDGYGGSGKQGGQQLNGHNGGFFSNATDSTGTHNGNQGASLFIVADEIDGLSLDCLSTGGCGGVSYYSAISYTVTGGKAGGCGYGGGGATLGFNYGGQGGVHGGGSGGSNQSGSEWTGGGGSSGFCTIYANQVSNQSTANMVFD